ncbi:MAG: endonuclease/exonuclease/phosphatase family protein [Thermoanaerobaculia bacterium]|nr:endonuclease/exonuclease/phosphatase family protein [Thermoanaerobaculia bacterium]
MPRAVLVLVGWLAVAPPVPGDELTVLSFNVWHGLRRGESLWRFPGEPEERRERRFAAQVEEIRRLDPDLILLQEVNPNRRGLRRYARALGYTGIGKVASCGLHLGLLLKIPVNVNEGLAILARPGLELRRLGSRRLSGNGFCTPSFGLQTRESRYLLVGSVRHAGREVVVGVTHLFAPPFLPPGFDEGLDRLASVGRVTPRQRRVIEKRVARGRERSLVEARRLLADLERRRRRVGGGRGAAPAILGGDFNVEPGAPGILEVERAGYRSLAVGLGFATRDPLANAENYRIAAQRDAPVPTFGLPELEALLEPRHRIARQIDHLFAAGGWRLVVARRVLDEPVDGLLPSDHFGLLATLAPAP